MLSINLCRDTSIPTPEHSARSFPVKHSRALSDRNALNKNGNHFAVTGSQAVRKNFHGKIRRIKAFLSFSFSDNHDPFLLPCGDPPGAHGRDVGVSFLVYVDTATCLVQAQMARL